MYKCFGAKQRQKQKCQSRIYTDKYNNKSTRRRREKKTQLFIQMKIRPKSKNFTRMHHGASTQLRGRARALALASLHTEHIALCVWNVSVEQTERERERRRGNEKGMTRGRDGKKK